MTHYDYWQLVGPAAFVIGTIVSMHYWSRLGKAGRAVVTWLRTVWRDKRETIQGVAFLTLVCLLALGWSWLRWILTHEVE